MSSKRPAPRVADPGAKPQQPELLDPVGAAPADPTALDAHNARFDQPLPALNSELEQSLPERNAIVDLEDAVGAEVKRMAMAPGHIPPRLLNVQRYVSRIHIVDAWQYRGTLRDAPDFIDRSWAAWDDGGGGLPAGPALRVPSASSPEGVKLCRGGDYVVRQQVTLFEGIPPDENVEVWQREEFERLFLPSTRAGDPSELEETARQAPPLMEDA